MAENIHVAIRIRPMSENEAADEEKTRDARRDATPRRENATRTANENGDGGFSGAFWDDGMGWDGMGWGDEESLDGSDGDGRSLVTPE